MRCDNCGKEIRQTEHYWNTWSYIHFDGFYACSKYSDISIPELKKNQRATPESIKQLMNEYEA